mmetsp:Transcript_6367/g.16192  ORF Transcript_6367/g.16192 Transcript_6367/m.16192 type:complete len:203 (+) Transcript_6367:801-1409(+)
MGRSLRRARRVRERERPRRALRDCQCLCEPRHKDRRVRRAVRGRARVSLLCDRNHVESLGSVGLQVLPLRHANTRRHYPGRGGGRRPCVLVDVRGKARGPLRGLHLRWRHRGLPRPGPPDRARRRRRRRRDDARSLGQPAAHAGRPGRLRRSRRSRSASPAKWPHAPGSRSSGIAAGAARRILGHGRRGHAELCRRVGDRAL